MTLNRLRNLFFFLCEATFLPERKDSRQFVADANPHSSAGRAHKRVPAYKTHAATLHPELFSALCAGGFTSRRGCSFVVASQIV